MENLFIMICALGMLVVMLFLIIRKKEQPKDVFFTPKTEPIKAKPMKIAEAGELARYQGLRFYSVYLWFYQRKDKNRLTQAITRLYRQMAILSARFPKVFEYVFLVMCIPQQFARHWAEDLKGLDQNQRNRIITERNIMDTLMFIPFLIVFGISISPTRIFWSVVFVLLLLGNIATGFRKLDQELNR